MGQGFKQRTIEPVIHSLDEVHLVLSGKPLEFDRNNRADIEAYWQRQSTLNPRLWNGPMFMFDQVMIDRDVLRATGHRTDFATFLYWRDNGRPDDVVHITGTSLPVTTDGALFAVRMASHTANAGHVYFPAGSLDDADLADGRFDIRLNVSRELAEETGFAHEEAGQGPNLVAAFDDGAYHIACPSRLNHCYAECAARLADHQRATGDDELAGAVAIRPDNGSLAQLRPYARMLADWHFAGA